MSSVVIFADLLGLWMAEVQICQQSVILQENLGFFLLSVCD